MTKEELLKDFQNLGIESGTNILLHGDFSKDDFADGDRQLFCQALAQLISPAKLFNLSSTITSQEYENLLTEKSFVLFLNTDYTTCPVMKYAETLSRHPYTTEQEEMQAFHLVKTALENRFWGDEDVLRFGKIGNASCRLVNYKLLVDYVADWIFKNNKSK